jgi:hypothetical protein
MERQDINHWYVHQQDDARLNRGRLSCMTCVHAVEVVDHTLGHLNHIPLLGTPKFGVLEGCQKRAAAALRVIVLSSCRLDPPPWKRK